VELVHISLFWSVLRTIAKADELTLFLRESVDVLKTEIADWETRLRAAIPAEDQKPESDGALVDPETREHEALKATITPRRHHRRHRARANGR